jgi:hypothetical protein
MKMMNQELKKKKEICLFYKMEPNIKGSGTKQLIRDTEEDIRFGLTEAFTKDTGKLIRLMVEED